MKLDAVVIEGGGGTPQVTGGRHIADVVDGLAASRGADTALSVDGHDWSYARLAETSRRAGRRLHEQDVRAGEIVAMPMPNSHEQVACFVGAWRLGATPLPLPPAIPEAELAPILRSADARVVLREGQDLAGAAPWDRASVVSPRCRAQASGGSTGAPKVIVDTEPGLVDPAEDHWGWTGGQGLFVPGPTFHSGPMNHLIGGLTRGVQVLMMRRFDAERAIALVAERRPHWALLVPTMMNRILKAADRAGARASLRSLERVWHSAAACPAWLKAAWINLLGPDAIWEIFGGSEGVATTVISGRDWLARPGSVGRAAGHGEIAILDADRRPAPTGTVGEIFMRNRVDARRFVVLSDITPRLSGEWESFGDLGRLDEDGFLYLADRRVDMINTGGQNVYPAEVEAAILSHPAVGDAVVFGRRDEDLGQIVVARVFVEGGRLDRDALLGHLATRISRYKIPRQIEVCDAPIRNDAGKVRRSGLAAASANTPV